MIMRRDDRWCALPGEARPFGVDMQKQAGSLGWGGDIPRVEDWGWRSHAAGIHHSLDCEYFGIRWGVSSVAFARSYSIFPVTAQQWQACIGADIDVTLPT